ncbi:hypothetical protein HYW87_04590, partial [Candidatus Roizmanbacteria bacterium]|nr:hypothetical protein [Candidatus Roizmanbacteria bacterium]
MKPNFFAEVSISIILVIFSILLLNPFDLLMPQPVHMLIIIGLALIFFIFVSLVWREKPADERENLHRYIAGRFAYLTGITILTIEVIVQSLRHALDPWLAITLIAMILAKTLGSLYGRIK